MLHKRWKSRVIGAVLLNYTAILTLGFGLHHHGHDVLGTDESPCVAGGCCSDAEHSLPSRTVHPKARPSETDSIGTPHDGQTVAAAHCLLCRFLTQKPAPAHFLRLTTYQPLVDRSQIQSSSPSYLLWAACGDIRAPPVIG
jgi:hypothetical protein